MKIAIATDHAGIELKEALVKHLENKSYEVLDLGPFTPESSDYPDFSEKVTSSILRNKAKRGILICGTGIGMSIAANRHPGIRAAVACNATYAELARAHNDANILCLGARFISEIDAIKCVDVFLETPFNGGRHAQRVKKLG